MPASLNEGEWYEDDIYRCKNRSDYDGYEEVDAYVDLLIEFFEALFVLDTNVERQEQESKDAKRWHEHDETAIVLVELVLGSDLDNIKIVYAFAYGAEPIVCVCHQGNHDIEQNQNIPSNIYHNEILRNLF